MLYLIDRQGVDLLQNQCGYNKAALRWSPNIPSHQFLMHTLGLTEIRLAATLACREHGYILVNWLDERAMKANYDRVHVGRKLESVLPDAYFVISLPAGRAHFLLEFDRGPESLNIFKTKIATYLSYFRTDLPKNRYATDKIRVLTIVEGSQARLANLKAVTEKLGGNRRFWFSRLDSIANEDILVSSIWEVAGDSKLTPLIPLSSP